MNSPAYRDVIYAAFLHTSQIEAHHNSVDKCKQVLFPLFIEKGAEAQGGAWFNQGQKAELKYEHGSFDAISGAAFTRISWLFKIIWLENL